ncbi:hypothetical protein [Mycolicibacterium cosmeticum]|uniref:hypothetical protein n=1 Tax=Mycolicibacterium cosmeticum TaxID=258533 RepID=UPI0032047B60
MTTEPKLTPGDRFDLARAVVSALTTQLEQSQRAALVRAFGIEITSGSLTAHWINDFVACDEQKLIELADYLAIEEGVEEDEAIDDEDDIPAAQDIDTYSQLVAAETAFREIVRSAIGSDWTEDFTAEKLAALEEKRDAEDKRRDGVTVSQDLLDYTEAYHLESLILKHWDKTGPMLKDKKRTEAYLNVMLDVRNTIAHSRAVVPFERHLLAGIAGQIQNLISVYRSGSETADAYYASINYVRDSFGDEGHRGGYQKGRERKRLKIGQVVGFEFSATDPHDREIEWTFSVYSKRLSKLIVLGNASGRSGTFSWTVGEDAIGEQTDVWVAIANESPYQRDGTSDDKMCFSYAVSPPVPPRVR